MDEPSHAPEPSSPVPVAPAQPAPSPEAVPPPHTGRRPSRYDFGLWAVTGIIVIGLLIGYAITAQSRGYWPFGDIM